MLLLPAMAIWAGTVSVRCSVFTLTALFLVCTSVLTSEFLSFHVAGLTWTVDRFVFVLLLCCFLIGWRQGKHNLGNWECVDYLMAAFTFWLAARTLTQPLGSTALHQPHTLMHMINGYSIPFTLYAILRSSRPDARQLQPALWIIAIFGIYLSLTSVFEISKMWSMVYPKFIADPALGIHFGRARGPMLQSVRLGICLLACWTAIIVFTVWLKPHSKSSWIAAIASLPIFWSAIFATYTRSIWMALASVVAILVLLCLQGRLRRIIVTGGALAGVTLLCVMGSSLVAFQREYSAAETRESTYMRAAFAYVSFQMIKDRPVAGFGFNQFNVANRPYLADRSTDIRLESIRNYVHHNSFLSLLVDLGIIGFSLYSLMLIGLIRESWNLWLSGQSPKWARGIALVALCLTAVHLIQMAFHEVSFSAIENSILFSLFGLVMAVKANDKSRWDRTQS